LPKESLRRETEIGPFLQFAVSRRKRRGKASTDTFPGEAVAVPGVLCARDEVVAVDPEHDVMPPETKITAAASDRVVVLGKPKRS